MEKNITASNKTNIGPKPITITFFQALSSQGKELYHMFRKAMAGYVLRRHPVKLIEQKDYQMMPTIMACLDSDVVIFDGSIEGDCKQYRAALEMLKKLDHVLIVSRTILPVNFEGIRKGGAPGIIKTGASEYSEKMTNEDILKWLLNTLEHSSMELPRKLKMNLPTKKDYVINAIKVLKVEFKMYLDSLKRSDKDEGVFVSYLSRYSQFYQGEHPEEPFVEELFASICEISRVSKDKIWYFPPGNISLEFMTAQRGFEIASITNKFIENCKAFWIYDTPDYSSSWWVYGEKISLLMTYYKKMEQCPNIYVVKPFQDENGNWKFDLTKYLTIKEKINFLPKLSSYQLRELSRFYINYDPKISAYELVERMRKLAALSDCFLKTYIKLKKPFAHWIAEIMSIVSEMDERKTNEMKKFLKQIQSIVFCIEHVRSYVYTKEFREKYIIECPICRDASKKQMNPENYMYLKEKYFYHVAQSDYQAIMKSVKQGNICDVKLPCGHTVSVKYNGVYYRWWTVKSNAPTGPDDKFIETVDSISFC